MKTLYYGYDKVVRELDSYSDHQDEYERPSTDSSHYLSNNVYSDYSKVKESHWESFTTNLDPTHNFYLVIAIYSTGDSFGCDSGACLEIVDSFADLETAEMLQAAAEKVKGTSLKFHGNDYYIPWTGYFESLDYIEVVKVSLY